MRSTPVTTDEAIALITAAATPAALFGSDPDRMYRQLARAVHPDTHPGNAAEAAFKRLTGLRDAHSNGDESLIARGDIANLYRAGPGLIAKIPRDPADSDLIRTEAKSLRTLATEADPKLAAFYPRLAGTARQKDPATGAVRQVNTIGELEGFVTLAAVQAAYPAGLDPRDAAWMWRRLLAALGGAHRAGLVHGAVVPTNVLIHPAEHGLVIADWCYSGPGPEHKLPAAPCDYLSFYPPEVLAGTPAGQDCDIWAATTCMTTLIGAALPRQMRAFTRGCQLPAARETDAWAVLADFDDLIGRMYGPRRFRPFAMPAAGTTTRERTP
jgi:Protein kinase domain